MYKGAIGKDWACSPSSCNEPVGLQELEDWAMELGKRSNMAHGIPAHPCGSCIIVLYSPWRDWEAVGSLTTSLNLGEEQLSHCELVEMGLDVACQHQRGDQLLWLWQAKLKFSNSAVKSLLLVLQRAWAGQMEGTCLAGGQTVSQ